MAEQATFETRAVLGPQRAGLARLTLLLPAAALVAIVWAGLSGARPDRATAEIPDPAAAAVATAVPRPQAPAKVLGLSVHRLDEVEPYRLGRDDVIAVVGWYVATAITDCPPLAAFFRDGALPEVRPDIDSWAFCDRSGVLYASQPGPEVQAAAGVSAVAATLAIGVVAPPGFEVVGAAPKEVVVIGRFVPSGDPCYVPFGCGREFVVDHVGWTAAG
ncbi:MAG: hypothetical protein ACAH65_04265 [Chloroflexota bacterium]